MKLHIRRIMLLVVILVGLTTLTASTALAFPGVGDCKSAPEPEWPGAGFTGQLDANPTVQATPGSLYADQGYAGLVWHTYDLGCIPGPDTANAEISTWTGNQLFNVAKDIVAATNGLHSLTVQGGALSTFDDFVVNTSHVMYDGVFVPWFGVAAIILAILLFRTALAGDLADSARRVLIALGALAMASACYLTPLLYTGLMDDVAVGGVEQLRSNVLGLAGVNGDHDLPTTLHQQVVVLPWLQGEFGSADSPQAKTLGTDLAHAQAFTYTDTAAGHTDTAATDAKKAQFDQVAARAGAAYPFLTGKQDARIGAGISALARAVTFTPFQLVADAGMLLCQILLRLAVIAGPAIGLFALLSGKTLTRAVTGIVGALAQSLILAGAGCVHLLVLIWMTNPIHAFSPLFQMIVMGLTTLVMWVTVRPTERLRGIASSAGGIVGLGGFSAQERMLRKLVRGQRRQRRRRNGETWEDQAGWWFNGQPRPPETEDPAGTAYMDATRMPGRQPWEGRGPGAAIDGGPIRPEAQPDPGIGLRHHTAERAAWDAPRPPVWAQSWRDDRSDGGGGSPVTNTPQNAGIGAGIPALPPGEPDAPPNRAGDGDPPAAPPQGPTQLYDEELYDPDREEEPSDGSGREQIQPPDDWDPYIPPDDDEVQGRPVQGRRPEEGEY